MKPDRERIGVVHRAWFGAITIVYFVFLALIPPFQSNDEDAHWMRAWSVAEGKLTCGPIPATAIELAGPFGALRGNAPMTRWLFYASMYQRGHEGLHEATGAPCMYIPVSYVGPALLVRAITHPFDAHGASRMLIAFYASRLFNLVLLAVSVFLFLRAAPALRSLTLLLYSLPMAIQQSVSINQESTILCLFFCMIALWWARPSVRRTKLLLLVVTLLALTKPTYLIFLSLWAASLLRLRRADVLIPWRRIALLAVWVVVPLSLWGAWSYFVAARPETLRYLPSWVVMPAQIEWVKSNPWMLWDFVKIQFHDLLGRDHLRGGWIGVLGVLGWADYEIGQRAYNALLVAVPLAFVADFCVRPGLAPDDTEPRNVLVYVLPALSGLLIIPAITIALYFQFNAPHATYSMGMTGRYLHVPYFLMLASLLLFLRDRLAPTSASLARRPAVAIGVQAACAALCLLGAHDAILAIWHRFYV